jgi:glycosyltransferase involved in cell wall biosynthesis
MAQYTENINVPKILDLIDSMQLNFERRVAQERYPLKWIFNMELKRLRRCENEIASKYGFSIVVSDKDKECIHSNNVVSIPLGVDTEEFRPYGSLPQNRAIVFSGNMGYFPNENAILWFHEQCLDKIRKSVPDVRLLIVGNNPGPRLKALNNGNSVIVTGYVDSIAGALSEAQIAIAPMQAGSGMQFKILETMACGLPVVATTLGLGTIAAVNGESIVVADSPEQFAEACITLLKNYPVAEEVGRNARQLVVEKYSWERNIASVNEIYSIIT